MCKPPDNPVAQEMTELVVEVPKFTRRRVRKKSAAGMCRHYFSVTNLLNRMPCSSGRRSDAPGHSDRDACSP